jgi:RND family efflux transporter MFP subunit
MDISHIKALIKKHSAVSATLIVSFIGILWIFNNAPEPEQKAMKVKVPKVPYVTLEISDKAIPIYSRGKAFASEVRQITNEVPGLVRLVSKQLSKGTNVKKGDILVQLDEQPFILDVSQKQSELDRAKLEQEKMKAKAKVARKGLKRNASEFARYIPQLRHAKSQVEAAEAALAYAQRQLEKTTITAPIDGKVIDFNITEGQFIQATSAIAKIYGTQEVEVRLPLNDHQINILGANLESPPKVDLNSYQDTEKRWKGHVVRTEGERDINQLLYVIAKVTSDSPFNRTRQALLPGSFVEAKIEGQVLEQLKIIPRAAEQSSNKVWVVDASNKLMGKTVDVIYRGKDYTYIRDGLNVDDRIVTGAFHLMVEGLQVEPFLETSKRLGQEPKPESKTVASAL